jgi:tetratricopeptide (TPR) repeat protein
VKLAGIRLPESIGKLAKLEVLDVSENTTGGEWDEANNRMVFHEMQLPESVGNLKSLKIFRCNNNRFVFPASFAELTQLEEIEINGSSNVWMRDFPEVLCELIGLKKLVFANNPVDFIPEAIVQLTQLEELNLNGSLGYIDRPLPDLSKLPRLKSLRFNGAGWGRTGAQSPKPDLLKQLLFLPLPAVEELSLDRWGENKEYSPEEGKHVVERPALKPELLSGIGRFKTLKILDLSFCDLSALPEDFYTLQNLEFVDFDYNKLPGSVRQRLHQTFPKAQFDFSNNHVEGELGSENADWNAMNQRIKEANALRDTQTDKKKLLQSLKTYEQVLDFFRSGKVVDEYNLLYAHYGKTWSYMHLLSKCQLTEKEHDTLQRESIAFAEKTLALVPNIIWHYTDLGKFHEEVSRIAANHIAWQMHLIYDDKANLEKALETVQKGVQHIEDETQWFIYDTEVRILMKLGRTEAAYRIVQRILSQNPSFGDFQDFKKNKDYQSWLKKQ